MLDEEAAQVVSSVFSACFPRLFKHFCELWSKKMGMGARILAVPQHSRRRKCCRKPRLCPWHRCLSRSQRKHQWPGTTWDVQALWPWNATNENTIWHDSKPTPIRIYCDNLWHNTNTEMGRCVKVKLGPKGERNRRENGTWADSACRMGNNQKITPDGQWWTCKFSAGTWSRSSRFLFLTTSPTRCRSHSQGKDWPHPDSALFWQNCVCWAPLVLFLRHAGSSLTELWTGCGPGTSNGH